MAAYNIDKLVQKVDEFLAYDVSLRIAKEFMTTPSDGYAGWQDGCQKKFDNMQQQIYRFILEF
jgi:hypothetical protein